MDPILKIIVHYGGAISIGNSASVNNCALVNNTAPKGSEIYIEYGDPNLNYNWWGSNNPNWDNLINGTYELSVYAILNITANPNEIYSSEKSNITTKFICNGTNTDVTNLIPKRNVKLTSNGTLTETEGTVGLTSKFSATKGGIYYVNATVDNQELEVNVEVDDSEPIPTNITVNTTSLELTIGETGTINATLNPSEAGELTVDYDKKIIKVEQDEVTGEWIVAALAKGNMAITFSFSGSKGYAPAEDKTVSVTVNSASKKLNLKWEVYAPKEVKQGESFDIDVKFGTNPLTPSGTVTMKIPDQEDITKDIKDLSTFTAKLTENSTITFVYSGDEHYYPSNRSADVAVIPSPEPGKKNITIEATAEPITVGDNATVVVTGFVGEHGSHATGTVTVTAAGKIFNGTIKQFMLGGNIAEITVPGLTENTTAIVNYLGDENYNPATTTVNITVKEDENIIVKAPDVTKYYRGPERFVVTITDSKGKALENKSVTITINGVPYSITTNANGTCSIALNLPAGVYNVTITVENNTVNSVVTILTTVNGTDVVKVFRNGTQYYATFRDSEGTYLADGSAVSFNINGVMYDRKVSGGKGLAKLNINLEQGEYVITAINNVTDEMSSNNITVLSRIIENSDLTKYYRNATQYTVKIIGDDGKVVGAGVNVTFNINGVFYTRQTNASGIAKLNINLEAGDYVITAECQGCKVSNNIKVLSVLTAKDMVKKYGTPDQFVATLVDGQGNPYAKENVQFNVNGILYNRATDSAGQAKLNINLMAGEYIITSSYNGCNIANKITVQS